MTGGKQPLSIRFPGALYERLRKAAYEHHESMTTIVLRGTERELDHLDRHDDTKPEEGEQR